MSRVANLDDQKLAQWMFRQLLKLNPKHKAPNIASWVKDIRLMRERDNRTLDEITELFKWANSHTFWYKNIESPGKLREQWDRLMLDRRGPPTMASNASATDNRCAWLIPDGNGGETRCNEFGVINGFCRPHNEEHEKRRELGG